VNVVRVVAPGFEATFETDGRVCRSTQNLDFMIGWTDERAAAYIERQGWRATLVGKPLPIEDDPTVRAILSTFPGSRIVAVRERSGSR